MFYFTFTATGKSVLAQKYSNVINMESTIYKYIGSYKENENLKGTQRKINNQWPDNYFKELIKVKEKYDYILISDTICDSFLKENELEYWWVYPDKKLKKEYMNRCKSRGNNDEFINWYSKLWDEWIEKCEKDIYATKHIKLKSNQFLEDVLPNLKIKKEKNL